MPFYSPCNNPPHIQLSNPMHLPLAAFLPIAVDGIVSSPVVLLLDIMQCLQYLANRKPQHMSRTKELFQNTNVHLIGSYDFVDREEFVTKKSEWKAELQELGKVVSTQPHVPFSVFVLGCIHKFTHLFRTTPRVDHLFQTLEEVILHDSVHPSLDRKSTTNFTRA